MRPRPAQAPVVMARRLLATLASEQFAKAIDDEQRAWILLLDLCDALHPLGAVTVPHRARVVALVRRIERDAAIEAGFNGRNYAALAREHRLTTRQVRRIIERGRRARRR